MGIRSRTITLVAAASIVLWIVVTSVTAVYLTRASIETDAEETVAALDIASAAVAGERDRLVTVCSDWAVWDDSFDFVERPNDEYIQTNLVDETLVNLSVDFMVFTDASGRIVYGKALDPATHQATSIPDGLVRYLATRPALLRIQNPRTAVSGALSLPEGPYLIAAQPIGKSDFSATPDGTFITGIRVDERTLSKLRRLTLHPLSIYSSTSPTLPADVRSARSSLARPGEHLIATADEKTSIAYGLVAGIESQPGLVMRVEVFRTDYARTRSTIIGVGLGITALGLVVFTVLGFTLDRLVLSRLTGLNLAVREVALATDVEARVPVSGNDEISSLATEINRMLDDLGRSQSETSYLVEHDPLTGLYNRRHFEHELRREIDEHQRFGTHGAILWFDLDHFKDINDSLGHAAGDELLSAFGRHLQSETRSYCTVARLGGDEFGMLIPHTDGPDAAAAATRLIEGFSSRTFLVGDRDIRVSASAGVVLYPEHGDQTSELLARADIAMYDAKAEGGNRVVVYMSDDGRRTKMTERLEAVERILSAMREDRFLLYAQPIRSFADTGAQCFELFLRMRDELGDMVLPADIITTAERLGISRDVDAWVARRAIRLLALAQEEGRDVQFAINLSGSAFSDTGLLDIIRDEFEETGASPERLIIETTESTAVANMAGASTFIRALREIGCRFSLDDFGSSASSYYYLKHLPIDFLKIDGGLMTGPTADMADAHFVHAIVEMCHGLKIQTVAEYVENQQGMDAISQSGVDFAQGYYVGMPEPLDFYLGDRFAESGHAVGASPEAGERGEKPG